MAMLSKTTVTITVACSVLQEIYQNDHFTSALTVKADGTKLKRFLAFQVKGTYVVDQNIWKNSWGNCLL